MNEININLKFNEYEFRRVKTMGGKPIVYVDKDWVGEDVIILPVPLDITDRWIEKHKTEDGYYDITIQTDVIFNKTVSELSNVGGLFIPKEFIGLDVLIIKTPKIQNLY